MIWLVTDRAQFRPIQTTDAASVRWLTSLNGQVDGELQSCHGAQILRSPSVYSIVIRSASTRLSRHSDNGLKSGTLARRSIASISGRHLHTTLWSSH
ncbi:hypothetical protein RRG08_026353 [Elysia crispata]|uniref:Uncharacterized protein n=1 Tax=Elysia crispata TaxID=231223 RepID=A0AAE1CJM2_9GAST|nr:hypothetical protein RRG08_026353 [Elysia crispata]